MAVSLGMASKVGEDLVHLMKAMSALKHHVPRLHPDVETSAYPVLFAVSTGPLRVSAIAERIHSDVSTVSRQVSHLVQVRILEKVSDPADGRAQNIALAPDGKQLLEDIHESRGEMFATLMSSWTTDEAQDFDHSLRRLNDDLTRTFAARSTSGPTDRSDASTTTTTGKESM
ncbi:MarR family winged helix-turn-helix transcriptional regulator [Allobranchiibius sp. CTAmp26]|uniref:MarR family winged helix-turn-helix transcriptional regulator n=1 Tax=Allobranchiibius sp. CTAmp26 TaxID=2815214 RepID=UPI001AA18235|nr:MarR family transcriptional regulator [Allobranchiibius sp. CTAmp26]MBO1754787.1 MarR family transcriptional regulator [Allobranchiibius sp. CTAmp26]